MQEFSSRELCASNMHTKRKTNPLHEERLRTTIKCPPQQRMPGLMPLERLPLRSGRLPELPQAGPFAACRPCDVNPVHGPAVPTACGQRWCPRAALQQQAQSRAASGSGLPASPCRDFSLQ